MPIHGDDPRKKSFGRVLLGFKKFATETSYEDMVSMMPGLPSQIAPEQFALARPMIEALEKSLRPDELAALRVPDESRWPSLAEVMGMPLDRLQGFMKSISDMLTLLP